MSFSPPPPPGGSQDKELGSNTNSYLSRNEFARRPQVWVPPVIVFGAFASGYAIPWDFGPESELVIIRVVVPLSLAAVFCLVAAYYSYRTVPGWRLWSWIAFSAMALNSIHTSLFASLVIPRMVEVVLWLSVLGLGIVGTIGQEQRSDIHKRPTVENPGLNR